jgi:hypothetical protein
MTNAQSDLKLCIPSVSTLEPCFFPLIRGGTTEALLLYLFINHGKYALFTPFLFLVLYERSPA